MKSNKMKTKSIRATLEDAGKIEQASRELAAELQRVVAVSEVVAELTDGLKDAKERIKEKTKGIS